MQLPINDISVNLRLTQVETSLYRHSRHTHAWCNNVTAVQQHQTTPPNPFTPNISLPTFTLAMEIYSTATQYTDVSVLTL